jgi:hypothetical protein
MFYINPNDFEGCKSDVRIDLEGKAYNPSISNEIIFSSLSGERANYAIWEFDTEENRNKALDKIDEIVRAKGCLDDINRLRDYLDMQNEKEQK